MEVARLVGQAQMRAFSPRRIGLIIAGLEVPHCHLHLIPIDSEADLSFAKADHSPDPAALDDAADRLRAALRDQGDGAHVPAS
jgi:histidine triad (HIT) family protein